jgi:alcohol dehydrogenase
VLLRPSGVADLPIVFERANERRMRRLLDSARDAAQQRRHRSRPTMRALIAAPKGNLHWRQVPAPLPPSPLGATVRPLAIATCDIDCALCHGTTPLLLPLQLGHECVAEVTAVGAEVATVEVGERVIVPFQINCGVCEPCKAGFTGSCLGVPPIAAFGMGLLTGHYGGAFADELGVPYADAMLVPLPDGVDPAAAASLADNICDAYRHLAPHLPQVLQRDPDAEVLIVGSVTRRFSFGSSMPLYSGLIAKALGARTVTIADNRPAVAEHATRLGLRVIDPRELRHRAPAPLVVDVSVYPRGLALALANTAPDGICTSSGSLNHKGEVPLLSMYVRNVTLHIGRTHVRSLIPAALDLIVSGKLRPETVTATVAPLDEAPSVLRESFRSGGAKVVLTA